MNEVTKIEPSSCSSFPNSLHLSFHQAVLEKMKKVKSFTLEPKWEDIRSVYESQIDRLVDANRVSQATAQTSDLAVADDERDRIGSLVVYIITNACASNDAATRAAGVLLATAMQPYKGFQSEAYLSETATIKGMVKDLRKSKLSDALDTLALGPVLTKLEAANKKFEALSTAKTDEKTAASLLASTKELRRIVDAKYSQLCDLIYALGLLSESGGTDVESVEILSMEINTIIKTYKTSYNMSQGQKNKKLEFKPVEGGEESAPGNDNE